MILGLALETGVSKMKILWRVGTGEFFLSSILSLALSSVHVEGACVLFFNC
jgi:hypothetical protein